MFLSWGSDSLYVILRRCNYELYPIRSCYYMQVLQLGYEFWSDADTKSLVKSVLRHSFDQSTTILTQLSSVITSHIPSSRTQTEHRRDRVGAKQNRGVLLWPTGTFHAPLLRLQCGVRVSAMFGSASSSCDIWNGPVRHSNGGRGERVRYRFRAPPTADGRG